MRHQNDYTGKEVVITAQGTTYQGVLVEMTDDAILLRADTGYCEIRMAQVTRLEPVGKASSAILSPSPLSGLSDGDKK